MAETIGAAGIDRLLLGAAVGEPDRAEACWREFLAIQSVDDLWTADRQGLLPLIDTNLRDLPIDERPRLAGTRRKASRSGEAHDVDDCQPWVGRIDQLDTRQRALRNSDACTVSDNLANGDVKTSSVRLVRRVD